MPSPRLLKCHSSEMPSSESRRHRKQTRKRVAVGISVVSFLVAIVPNLSGTRSAPGVATLLAVSAAIMWWLFGTTDFVTSQHRTKRFAARLVSGLLLGTATYSLWLFFRPISRQQVKAELSVLAKAKAWNQLAEKLPSVEEDPALHDVGLYFRGLLYSSASPGPDPERYLAQIPPGSDMFKLAQWVRLSAWSKAPTEERAAVIAESLERASLRNPIYYRLRLAKREMSYADIAALDAQFVQVHQPFFDFSAMKHHAVRLVGVYVEEDLNDVTAIPACTILFLYREIDAARRECLPEKSRDASTRYDALATNLGREDFFLKRSCLIQSGLLVIDIVQNLGLTLEN